VPNAAAQRMGCRQFPRKKFRFYGLSAPPAHRLQQKPGGGQGQRPATALEV